MKEIYFNVGKDEKRIENPTDAFSVTRDEMFDAFTRAYPTERRVSDMPPPALLRCGAQEINETAILGNLSAEQQNELRNAYYALCIQKLSRALP